MRYECAPRWTAYRDTNAPLAGRLTELRVRLSTDGLRIYERGAPRWTAYGDASVPLDGRFTVRARPSTGGLRSEQERAEIDKSQCESGLSNLSKYAIPSPHFLQITLAYTPDLERLAM